MTPKKTDSGVGREPKSRDKRRELTGQIADLLLLEGVAQIPLRDLAKQLGTSDRMLLYYFDDKADLVRAALEEVSLRLGAMLAVSMADAKRTPAQMLAATARLLASPHLAPFINVWADLSARGGRMEEPFRSIARQSVERWLAWLDERLAVVDAKRRRLIASALLVVVEGVRLIECVAPGAASGATKFLASSFAESRIALLARGRAL